MARKIEPIIINVFNQGGIADSDYVGGANSFASMVGLDVHGEAGILKPNQKLTKDSGTTVTEFVENIVPCSDGSTYMFSSTSGKIWKRASNGTYSLAHTTTPISGGAGCLGAKEYDGYLYWATQDYLHRINITKTSNWATYAEQNWEAMHIDQAPLGGLGENITSAVLTAISETDTNKTFFTPRNTQIVAIAVYIKNIGTGNITLQIHDSNNTAVGDPITITHANLVANSDNLFLLKTGATPYVTLNTGQEYHFHLTSTANDSTVGSIYENELRSLACRIFAAGDNAYHPMETQNLKLYIGDRNFVHQVNRESYGHNFTSAALDLPKPHRIKALGKYGDSLLIGTYLGENITVGGVFRWDTWSVSFNYYDEIPEVGVNAFVDADNYVFISAGVGGRIYSYDGVRANLIKRIKGNWGTNTDIVYPNATVNFKGLPLIGYSNLSGNPHYMGVYSFGRTGANYPFILNMDYPISQRITVGEGEEATQELALENVYISAMAVSGNDLYVAWKHVVEGDPDVTTYGVDKLDYSNKLTGAFFETRILAFQRDQQKAFAACKSGYRSKPTSTDLTFYSKRNHGSYIEIETLDDTINQTMIAEDTNPANTIQYKGVFTCSSNDCIEIEDIRFNQRMMS